MLSKLKMIFSHSESKRYSKVYIIISYVMILIDDVLVGNA